MPPGYGQPRYPQGPVPEATFRRLAFFNEAEGVGARWWQQQLASAGNPVSRRSALTKIALIGTAVGATLAVGSCVAIATCGSATQDVEANLDALEVQKTEGWDVGVVGQLPLFPAATDIDIDNSKSWQSALDSLDTSLKPSTSSYEPYYVPTLFQVLGSPNGSALKSAIRPILTAEMDGAYARGKALASLFDDQATSVALVIDLPGPEAIAFAAGAAERFDPVFVFDNWPHPLGVVPAHLTLAAALYFHAALVAAKRSTKKRAPAFVLDRNRLTAYSDETSQFDNRYMAKLPPADRLSSLVKNVLYVTPADTTVTAAQELDDINDDLVAFAKQGLDVRAVALTSFLTPDGSVPTANLFGDAGVPTDAGRGKDSGAKDASLDSQGAEAGAGTAPITMNAGMANADAGVDSGTYVPRSPRHSTIVYYYGGYPYTHWYFWRTYSWYSPPAARYASPPRMSGVAPAYRPISRPTMFSSRVIGGSSAGIGRAKPTGFGRVSVLQSHGGGPVTATRFGGGGRSYPSGRSGSWGRSGGWGGSS